MSFVIAIDGHAASGKGTIARAVANHFKFSYLDTGLIYRAVAKLALSKEKGSFSVAKLTNIARSFKTEHLALKNLRSDEIGMYASKIAAIPEVRYELVKYQRRFMVESDGAVLDGRDIGTVIAPNAEIKLFITANLNIRTERRLKELWELDKNVSFAQVLNDLAKRDQLDSDRQDAPLKISSDAHLIDTSELSIEASIASVIELVKQVKEKI